MRRFGAWWIWTMMAGMAGGAAGPQVVVAAVTSGGGPINFTQLTSGTAVPFSLPAVTQPTLFAGDAGYRITVPTGATRLTVALVTTTPSVDVDLYVRFGQDPAISGGSVVADFRSEGLTGNETITITPSSSPTLQAGTYFVAPLLFNTGRAASGTLTATVEGGAGPRVLASGTPAPLSLPAVTLATLFNGPNSYRVDVPAGATLLVVQLTTTTPNVNVDLYVRFGQDVSGNPLVRDYQATGPTGNETITITTSSSPPLQAGAYFISLAVFTTGTAVTGTVTATVSSGPRVLTSGTPAPFSFPPVTGPTLFFGPAGYRIDVPAGPTQLVVQLTTATPNVDVDLFVRFGQEPAVAGGQVVADYRSAGLTGNETLTMTTASTPPLRTGAYFISPFLFTTGTAATGTVTATVSAAPPPPVLSITTTSLPTGTMNLEYSQALAASGGTGPYTWTVASGTPPAGLNLSPQGVLSGRPTSSGSTTFTVRVTDSRQQTATQTYTITVNAPVPTLAITTASLPTGTVGTAYPSTTLTATGGTPPYRQWAVTSGSLPPGIVLNNATGVISGTPTAAGSFTFTVTVADSANGAANRNYTIQMSLPGVTVTVGGIGGTLSPLAQPSVSVNLAQDYPTDVTGTLTMTFTPDAVVTPTGTADARFSNGQRTIDFTVPRGSRTTSVGAQAGTVAGQVTVSVTRLQSGSTNLTPLAGPVTATIARAAPVVIGTCMAPSGSGFVIVVTGYSTPREVTRANFRFTGAAGVTLEGSAPVLTDAETKFGDWFRSTPSFALGSQFKLTATFAVDNGSINSIGQAFVTLANNTGAAAEQAVTRQASCP